MPRKVGDAETSMFTRGRIIGMYEGGVPKMMISKKLNIDPKTIRKWILRYEAHDESGLKSIPKPGAHRKTTAFEDIATAKAIAVTNELIYVSVVTAHDSSEQTLISTQADSSHPSCSIIALTPFVIVFNFVNMYCGEHMNS